jgi:hypothetical protein
VFYLLGEIPGHGLILIGWKQKENIQDIGSDLSKNTLFFSFV